MEAADPRPVHKDSARDLSGEPGSAPAKTLAPLREAYLVVSGSLPFVLSIT